MNGRGSVVHQGCGERLASLRGIMATFGAAALTINVLRAGLEFWVEIGHNGLWEGHHRVE
jgi:hypothetical protein